MRITSCSLWWTQHLNELLVYFTLIEVQHSIPLYFCIQCFKVSSGFSKVYLYLGCAKVGTSNVFGLPSKSKTNSTLYLKSTIRVNKLAAQTKWDPKFYFQNGIWHLIIEITLCWLWMEPHHNIFSIPKVQYIYKKDWAFFLSYHLSLS